MKLGNMQVSHLYKTKSKLYISLLAGLNFLQVILVWSQGRSHKHKFQVSGEISNAHLPQKRV